jgi:flavin reductase (DIM6/NTAB) family NADH-FMN oxidoreductase RutF
MSDNPIKDALKLMPYGFYAITSRNNDDVNIMVANWLTQVSFEPRLVAMGLQKGSYTHGLISEGGVFAVNIFRKEDQDTLMPFTKSRSKNPDKIKDSSYTEAPETGCPVLEGAAAYIEFKVADLIDVGGDHDILVGEAIGAGILKEAKTGDILTLPDIGWGYAG